jgi:hypothetical protein
MPFTWGSKTPIRETTKHHLEDRGSDLIDHPFRRAAFENLKKTDLSIDKSAPLRAGEFL